MELSKFIVEVRGQIRDTGSAPVFQYAIPPTDTEPGKPDEIEQFVRQAIQDYSGWKPLRGKRGRLNLLQGQDEYSLPEDFIRMEEFLRPHRISGKLVYLLQMPLLSDEVIFFYTAMHQAETIPDYDVPAVCWLAASLALKAVMSDPNRLDKYVSYNLDEVFELNTENLTEATMYLAKAADQLEKQYLARMTATNKPIMTFG
ncbi:hypothetical protein POF51_22510 [Brevibacillus sp. AG]|uniref:hypothetical protein n=1 Tax=Brevibacillus sp. AG TaxID=3020891 RepID=UPI00232A8896|nr:hypothetical protein [Brevibacillus sp. AG]MDC0763502.1 hypothetical protein [Brevibacillus sp. AG]